MREYEDLRFKIANHVGTIQMASLMYVLFAIQGSHTIPIFKQLFAVVITMVTIAINKVISMILRCYVKNKIDLLEHRPTYILSSDKNTNDFHVVSVIVSVIIFMSYFVPCYILTFAIFYIYGLPKDICLILLPSVIIVFTILIIFAVKKSKLRKEIIERLGNNERGEVYE